MTSFSLKPTFLDFFAGAGLAELGLEDFFDCVWANDIDPKKAEVYRANFGLTNYVVADVNTIRTHDLPPASLAWASFPCQDLSLAGWRRGMSAGRSGTFWAFWRLMANLYDENRLPRLIVLENVTGLLNSDSFIGLCEALAALDMQFGVLLMDAKDFLPQSRPRVFVVALAGEIDASAYHRSDPGASRWVTPRVKRAFANLPPGLKERWRWWKLAEPSPVITTFADIVETEPEGVAWNSEIETQKLLSMMSTNNRAKVEDAIQKGGTSVGLLYKRTRSGIQRAEIRFDGIAGCLRTPSGGSSRQTVVVVEDGKVRSRLLSPREAARLMGVEDTFELPKHYNQAYKAMGDAVAVPTVRWLGENLLGPLSGLDRQYRTVPTANLSEFRRSSESHAERWAAGNN